MNAEEAIEAIKNAPNSGGHGLSIADWERSTRPVRSGITFELALHTAQAAAEMAYRGKTREEIEDMITKRLRFPST